MFPGFVSLVPGWPPSLGGRLRGSNSWLTLKTVSDNEMHGLHHLQPIFRLQRLSASSGRLWRNVLGSNLLQPSPTFSNLLQPSPEKKEQLLMPDSLYQKPSSQDFHHPTCFFQQLNFWSFRLRTSASAAGLHVSACRCIRNACRSQTCLTVGLKLCDLLLRVRLRLSENLRMTQSGCKLLPRTFEHVWRGRGRGGGEGRDGGLFHPSISDSPSAFLPPAAKVGAFSLDIFLFYFLRLSH